MKATKASLKKIQLQFELEALLNLLQTNKSLLQQPSSWVMLMHTSSLTKITETREVPHLYKGSSILLCCATYLANKNDAWNVK